MLGYRAAVGIAWYYSAAAFLLTGAKLCSYYLVRILYSLGTVSHPAAAYHNSHYVALGPRPTAIL